MTTCDSIVRRFSHFIVSLSAIVLLGATASSASSPYCSNAQPIGLDESVRGDLLSPEPDCFRLQTPAAGLVMFDLAVPGTAVAEPRLGLQQCDATGRVDVLDRSASHLLISGDAAGELTVCVGAQDPSHRLGRYNLQAAFVEIASRGFHKIDEIEVEPDPFAGCRRKIDEIEVEPDPFAGCRRKIDEIEVEPDPFAGCRRKIDEIEVEPDPLAGCRRKIDEIEVEPDPLAGCRRKIDEIEVEPDPLTALCQPRGLDDHSDSLLCATAIGLGQNISGEIANGWGDDRDVFAFELTNSQTVRITTSGEVVAFVGLLDRRGQRLAGDGAEDLVRLTKTLPPGLYFVQVEGMASSQGSYTLDVDMIVRSW